MCGEELILGAKCPVIFILFLFLSGGPEGLCNFRTPFFFG